MKDVKSLLNQAKVFSNSLLNVSAYAGYLESENAIVVSFRDTVNIQNWIATLDVQQVTYPAKGCSDCMVHEGLYNAFQSVEGYMRSLVENLKDKYSGSKFYFTGFGVGGALATFAALDIK